MDIKKIILVLKYFIKKGNGIIKLKYKVYNNKRIRIKKNQVR